MSAESIDIQKLATLARLKLTPEESAQFHTQLQNVVEYVNTLSRYDLESAEPTAHAMPMFDVVRTDAPRPGLTQEAALANAPKRAGNQFQIPKVVE